MDQNHILSKLLSPMASIRDAATEESSEVFRTTASEESFARNLLNAQNITADKCDRLPSTQKPVKFDEMEHECERAVTIPFGGQPMNAYMHLPLFITTFARNVSPRVYDDKDNLLMYRGDIEQLFYTLLLREVMDREVRAFIGAIDLLCGDLNATDSAAATETGAVAYATVGAASMTAFGQMMKALPSTYGNLAPKTLLVNNTTIWDIRSVVDTNAAGDSLAEKTFLEGYSVIPTINGVDLMVTMKNRVVEDDVVYILTDADHLGRMYILEDAVLQNDSKAWFVDMYLWTCLGGSLPNSGAFRKASLTGSYQGSWKIEDLDASSVSA